MSRKMLSEQGRTFTMSSYVLIAGTLLVVFGMLLSHRDAVVAPTVVSLLGLYRDIAVVAIGALGFKGSIEGWQQGKQPSSERTVTEKTVGPA